MPRELPPAPIVPIGTVYGVPLGGGLYGLARVIGSAPAADSRRIFANREQRAAAIRVLATRWTGPRAALASALDDPRASRPLVLTHHTWRKRPFVICVFTRPPRSLIRVGERAPSAADRKLKTADFAWEYLRLQYRAQLAWEAERE